MSVRHAPPAADPFDREGRAARLAALRREFVATQDEILRRFPHEAARVDQLEQDLRAAIVVLGSPRGGTSVFKSSLAAAFDVAALPGEHRPFFTLLGRNFPDHGDETEADDVTPLGPDARRFLLRSIFLEAEQEPTARPTRRELERYAWAWALRLPIQWTGLRFRTAEIVARVEAVASQWADRGEGQADLTIEVLRALRADYPDINPWQYDLDRDLVARAFPDVAPLAAPPDPLIVEITPFTVPAPCRERRPGALPQALLLKASSDPYRLSTITALLAGWNLQFVHLARNPLAAVNGLLDGWAYHGFWQHELPSAPPPLRAWCFDLVPGWRARLGGGLLDICVDQWLDPSQRILRLASRADAPVVRVGFEAFIRDDGSRGDVLRTLAAALGHAAPARVDVLRPVNVSQPPALGRWRKRAESLAPILNRPGVRDACEALGYRPADHLSWE